MYYGTINGERYPKEIFDRLNEKEKSNFIEIDNEEMFMLVKEANKTNCEIVAGENKKPKLVQRKVDETETLKSELESSLNYLQSTDYIYPKCLELGLDVNTEYAEIVKKRRESRIKIQELRNKL